MNSSFITTLPPPAFSPSVIPILSKNGFSCTLLTLAPGAETSATVLPAGEEQILFVVDGEAAVRFGDDVTTMLSRESALLIPSGREHSVAANAGGSTKILRIGIPARVVPGPAIVSFDS